MKISIVIPAYNCETLIRDTLLSIAQQHKSADEVWIVNDGSTDGTADVVKNFIAGRDHWHLLTKDNGGVSSARNAGVKAASGEWIAFMDSDDLWRPDHLACLMQEAGKIAADILVSGVEVFQHSIDNIIFTYCSDQNEIKEFPRSLYSRNNIVPSAVMMTRDAFLKLGGFDEEKAIQHAEDWDLWLRAISNNFVFHFTGINTVLYRKHLTNATANITKMQQVSIYCLKKNLTRQPMFPDEMKRKISLIYRRLGNSMSSNDRVQAGEYYRAAIAHGPRQPLNYAAWLLHSLHAMGLYRKLSHLWLTCRLKLRQQ